MIIVLILMTTASGEFIENDFEIKNDDNNNGKFNSCNTLQF